jgi:hypothetical protein
MGNRCLVRNTKVLAADTESWEDHCSVLTCQPGRKVRGMMSNVQAFGFRLRGLQNSLLYM